MSQPITSTLALKHYFDKRKSQISCSQVLKHDKCPVLASLSSSQTAEFVLEEKQEKEVQSVEQEDVYKRLFLVGYMFFSERVT